jgi:hypothetical protein
MQRAVGFAGIKFYSGVANPWRGTHWENSYELSMKGEPVDHYKDWILDFSLIILHPNLIRMQAFP